MPSVRTRLAEGLLDIVAGVTPEALVLAEGPFVSVEALDLARAAGGQTEPDPTRSQARAERVAACIAMHKSLGPLVYLQD